MLLGAHPRQIPEGLESFCPLTLGCRLELVWLLPCAQRHTEAFWLLNETPVSWRESLGMSIVLALVSRLLCSKACLCVDLQNFAFIQSGKKLVKMVTT